METPLNVRSSMLAAKAADIEERICVIIEYSYDGILGDATEAEWEAQGYDPEASARNYGETLAAVLEAEYPEAEIAVTLGSNDTVRVHLDDDDEDPTQAAIAEMHIGDDVHHLMTDYYETFSWMVPMSGDLAI